jgi:hypothetical protein
MKLLLIQHVYKKKRTQTNQKISIKKKSTNYPKYHKISIRKKQMTITY